MTVVLDSCYSGTGTRALGLRRPRTQLFAVADTAFKRRGRTGQGRKKFDFQEAAVSCRPLINLDAGGDPVGGTIADQFDVEAEQLGLQPTGCTTNPFTNIAIRKCLLTASIHSPTVISPLRRSVSMMQH